MWPHKVPNVFLLQLLGLVVVLDLRMLGLHFYDEGISVRQNADMGREMLGNPRRQT